jgi:hypothetical protein
MPILYRRAQVTDDAIQQIANVNARKVFVADLTDGAELDLSGVDGPDGYPVLGGANPPLLMIQSETADFRYQLGATDPTADVGDGTLVKAGNQEYVYPLVGEIFIVVDGDDAKVYLVYR